MAKETEQRIMKSDRSLTGFILLSIAIIIIILILSIPFWSGYTTYYTDVPGRWQLPIFP